MTGNRHVARTLALGLVLCALGAPRLAAASTAEPAAVAGSIAPAATAAAAAAPVPGATMPGAATASPVPDGMWGRPTDVSVHGHRIDWLLDTTNLFTLLLFLTMVVWMGIALVRHGEKHKAVYDHGGSRRAMMQTFAIAAAIFFVVDGNLFFNSTVDLHDVFWDFEGAEADPNLVRIEINSHQWAWDARYPGADGEFNTPDDVVTLNDIRIPVGTKVYFQIASVDVIHSFNLPNMRLKIDAVPGMINRLLVEAKETGIFEIACAQHCGMGHYKMRGKLHILPVEEWKAWHDDMSAHHARGWDANDTEVHWGWPWKEPK